MRRAVGEGIDDGSGGRYGFRVEFRDHIWSHYGETDHYRGIGGGVTIR